MRRVLVDRPIAPSQARGQHSRCHDTVHIRVKAYPRLAGLPQCIACPLSGCMPTKSMQDPVELARVHAEVDKLGGRTPTCG